MNERKKISGVGLDAAQFTSSLRKIIESKRDDTRNYTTTNIKQTHTQKNNIHTWVPTYTPKYPHTHKTNKPTNKLTNKKNTNKQTQTYEHKKQTQNKQTHTYPSPIHPPTSLPRPHYLSLTHTNKRMCLFKCLSVHLKAVKGPVYVRRRVCYPLSSFEMCLTSVTVIYEIDDLTRPSFLCVCK